MMVDALIIALFICLAIGMGVFVIVIIHWAIGNGDIEREIKVKRYKRKC